MEASEHRRLLSPRYLGPETGARRASATTSLSNGVGLRSRLAQLATDLTLPLMIPINGIGHPVATAERGGARRAPDSGARRSATRMIAALNPAGAGARAKSTPSNVLLPTRRSHVMCVGSMARD